MSLQKTLIGIKRKFTKSRDKWPEEKRVKAAMAQYKELNGHDFDINAPKLFTEKIIWYKLFYKREDQLRLVDKYLFKDYVRERLGDGYTIPLYGVWETFEDFEKAWDKLPDSFVLKSTIMGDGKGVKIIKDKSKADKKALFAEVRDWLDPYNTLINSFCVAYYSAKPRVIAEQFESQVGDQLYDYKIFCFDGEPYCFYVAIDHFPGVLSKISLYDLDWNRRDVRYGEHPNCEVEKPVHFDEMLEIARKLSKGFPFIRVDFFETAEKLYAAELTLYPGGGLTPYHPEEFDRELGDMFKLPIGK